MAKLLDVVNVSLDGYIADEDGKLDWTAADEEYFSFVNDLLRPVGTYLYGRRLYELMAGWETDPAAAARRPPRGRSRRSGRRPTRSCTPRRFRRPPPPARGSSGTSTPKRSGS